MGRGGHNGRELTERERLEAAVRQAKADELWHHDEMVKKQKEIKLATAALAEFLAPKPVSATDE